ncbi:MAG: GNAT family N-acetyltransferase [Candidatus Limnocylindrales bacterium]
MIEAAPGYRLSPCGPDDIEACLDIFYEATEELHTRTHQPLFPRNPQGLGKLFAHIIDTDPERTWLAEAADGGAIAFGLAHRRGSTWFLAFLFVRPAHQARSVGRAVLDACLAEDRTAATRLATCVESIQPVSAALYASYGMLPGMPLYGLTGTLDLARPLAPAHQLTPEPLVERGADTDSIDVDVLGYPHQQDHAWLRGVGRHGHLFRDASVGTAVGYGYVHPSGRIGPVAVRDERWLPEVIDHLAAAVPPPDAWLIFVPGRSPVFSPLMQRGLRIDGVPGIYCGTDDGPAFRRYLPANFAVL